MAAAQSGAAVPDYVGSQACGACHAVAAAAWEGSHHAWAWKHPDASSVLGDFDEATIEHRGVTSRFLTRDGRYFVETDGPDGTLTEFEVRYTAGLAPLQQYLLETEPGRLQALDLAWDAIRQRWYHLYPDQDLPAGDGLHWTGPYKTWNARCAECHATGFDKNYDPRARRYSSTQSEIGVGCEACHGPGEAHVAWARAPAGFDPGRWSGLTAKGFTIGFDAGSAETEIQQCAGCHSRREPLTDGNPLPGTAFHDAYRLALLREGLYHADGSIQDEVYVYGSFLQSRMYERGVRCSDCHDPHTATLNAEANAVCTQCHSPAGDARFPTLRPALYDDPSHHFHAVGSDGAQCASCHMIERVYMGIDGRRDHSFRIPRPDLSDRTGAPNACTDCHADRDASWAAADIASRFPGSDRRSRHFAQSFATARFDPAVIADTLVRIAEQEDLAGVVRASALDLLASVQDERLAGRVAHLLSDGDALVRAAAIAAQRGASPIDRAQRIIPLLEDPFLAVRIAAARGLLDAPSARLPPRIAAAAQTAMAEWRATLRARADFPETHLVNGGTALVMRNPQAAEAAFREAVRLDPQLIQAWVMIVRILAATGDLQGAETALEEALAIEPGDRALLELREDLDAAEAR
ncbi:MAG: tetratricopeptide repeat protein [Inquilinus sp.]|nr:tetratricopeptide repeat protein [Inquilinus sp.]